MELRPMTIEARIIVGIEHGVDPEDAASAMDRGLGRALEGFPEGTILGADVDSIREANDEEKASYVEE